MCFDETMIKLAGIIRMQSGIISALYRELSLKMGEDAAGLPCVADIEKVSALIRELEAEP